MRKLFSLIVLLVLTMACTSEWNHENPDMPLELKESLEATVVEQEALLSEDPENIEAMAALGFAHEHLGDWKKAVGYYENTLEQDPNHFVALNNLANIYEEMGDYDVANGYLQTLYLSNQENPEVLKDLVRVLLKVGNGEDASRAIQNYEKLASEAAALSVEEQEMLADLKADVSEWYDANME